MCVKTAKNPLCLHVKWCWMLDPDNYEQDFHRHQHPVGHLEVMLTVP